MSDTSYRIARLMAPHVTVSDSLGEAVARSLASQTGCPIEQCARTLRSFGEMACRLKNDPEFLRSLIANDATVRPHPAVRDFVKWLNDETEETFRLKIPPVVVTVVRAPSPAVLQVVEYRKAFHPKVVPFVGAHRSEGEHEITRLALTMIRMADAAARIARILDPARRGMLLQLIFDISSAVELARTTIENDVVGPTPHRPRVHTIAGALRQSDPHRTMLVHSNGLEVRFQLVDETGSDLPFRIVEVRNGI